MIFKRDLNVQEENRFSFSPSPLRIATEMLHVTNNELVSISLERCCFLDARDSCLQLEFQTSHRRAMNTY